MDYLICQFYVYKMVTLNASGNQQVQSVHFLPGTLNIFVFMFSIALYCFTKIKWKSFLLYLDICYLLDVILWISSMNRRLCNKFYFYGETKFDGRKLEICLMVFEMILFLLFTNMSDETLIKLLLLLPSLMYYFQLVKYLSNCILC